MHAAFGLAVILAFAMPAPVPSRTIVSAPAPWTGIKEAVILPSKEDPLSVLEEMVASRPTIPRPHPPKKMPFRHSGHYARSCI